MTDPLIAVRAELEVLAALLWSRSVRDAILIDHGIAEPHFAVGAHRAVFAAICGAHDQGAEGELSVAALAPTVRDDPRCSRDEGDQVLRQIEQVVPVIPEVGTHVTALRKLERRRAWREAGQCMQRAAETGERSYLAQADRLLAEEGGVAEVADTDRLADIVAAYLESTDSPAISTGIRGLDDAMGGGMRPGDSSALGAWSGFGKSVLADQILTYARGNGHKVHAYVNEMSFLDRALRMVSRTGVVAHSDLARKRLDRQQMSAVLGQLGRLPFGVTDVSSWDANRIARDIRARKWDLAVFDLLHNMPYEGVGELDRIVATLAAAARSSGTHLIIVCHLNQARAEGEIQPPPVLRDIRGSGMIKNVCASALFVHRDQEKVDGGGVRVLNHGSVYDLKHRHGPGGGAALVFDPQHMRFLEQAPAGWAEAA